MGFAERRVLSGAVIPTQKRGPHAGSAQSRVSLIRSAGSARVRYQFSWPETYKNYWCWSINYLNYKELRAYFNDVDNVLYLSKDCSFGTVVIGGNFHTEE